MSQKGRQLELSSIDICGKNDYENKIENYESKVNFTRSNVQYIFLSQIWFGECN